MPARVPLQFATAEMRLARPVVDADGRVLAGTGTRLDERVLRLLRRQAIQAVIVDDEGVGDQWEVIRPLDEELVTLEARFAGVARTAALDTLREAIERHVRRRAARFDDPGEAS